MKKIFGLLVFALILSGSGTQSVLAQSTPDFTISCSPSSQSATPGGSVNWSVTVSSVNGFSGNVQVYYSDGSVQPIQTVNVPSGGSATTNVSGTLASNTPAGTRTVVIQANNTANTIIDYCYPQLVVSGGSRTLSSVNIKANGGDGPISIAYGTRPIITWTSTSSDYTCTIEVGGQFSLTGDPDPEYNYILVNNGASSGTVQGNPQVNNTLFHLGCSRTVNGDLDLQEDTVVVNLTGLPEEGATPTGEIKCVNNSGFEVNGPCTIASGSATYISWTTENADNCEVGTTGSLGSGTTLWTGTAGYESTGSLTQTVNYALTCDTDGSGLGIVMDSVTVNVVSGQIQVSTDNVTYADSVTVVPGTLVYIKWSSQNAQNCSVAPGGWTGTSGTQSRNISVQRTYTLTCTYADVSVTDQAIVYMSEPDFTFTCTSLSKSVAAGQSTVFDTSLAYTGGFSSPVTVTITSGLPSGATSTPATVTPPATVGSVPVQTVVTTPQGTSNLTFTAIGGGQTHTCTSQLIITPPDGAPVLDSLVLTPPISIIDIAETVTYNAVAWYTDGTDVDVTLNPATQFASSDKSIASMSGHIATGEGDGTSTITAQYTEGAITVADTASLQVGAASGVSASLYCPAGSTQKVCTINSGSSIQLGWQSSGADDCSTDPALVPPASGTSGASSTGNLSGPQTIQYTLTCTGGGKGISATDTATVIVSGPGSSLVESDKDITYINGKSLVDLGLPAPSACSAGTDSVGNVTFKDGDIITFRICIKNSGAAAATSITLADQMTNLTEPATGFNVLYQGAPIAYDYDPATGTIDFTIPGSIGSGSTATLTFDAKVTKPTGSSSFTLYRFQNRAVIDTAESSDHTVTTPLYLFYAGTRVPSKEEVAP